MTGRHKEIKSKDILGGKKDELILIYERGAKTGRLNHVGTKANGIAGTHSKKKEGILPLLHKTTSKQISGFQWGKKGG